MRGRAAVVLCAVVLGFGGMAMGEFKSPRDTATGDVVSTWPAHQKAFEDSIIEATGQAAAVPFTGRILARLDDKGIVNGIASLDSTGKVPVAQLPAGSYSGASVQHTADQAMIDATELAVVWTSEEFDTDNFHDNVINNTRLTVPAGGTGYYLVTMLVAIHGTTTSGTATAYVRKNGNGAYSYGVAISDLSSNYFLTYLTATVVVHLNAGDYVEVVAMATGIATPTVMGTVGNRFQITKLAGG